MLRIICKPIVLLFVLAACVSEVPTLGPDGKPLPKLYDLARQSTAEVQFRMLDAINSLRNSSNNPILVLNPLLNAAAATHARDMSMQNRPWHFGSDGSSPLDRVERIGYTHKLVGELISETYETELETLSVWMENLATRRVLLDTDAAELGFAWYQEPGGKIWWALVLGEGPKPVTSVDADTNFTG